MILLGDSYGPWSGPSLSTYAPKACFYLLRLMYEFKTLANSEEPEHGTQKLRVIRVYSGSMRQYSKICVRQPPLKFT